jgi:hypothetical protein
MTLELVQKYLSETSPNLIVSYLKDCEDHTAAWCFDLDADPYYSTAWVVVALEKEFADWLSNRRNQKIDSLTH